MHAEVEQFGFRWCHPAGRFEVGERQANLWYLALGQMNLHVIWPRHSSVANLFLASTLCMATSIGCGPSNAQKQQMLKQQKSLQQQQALQQLLAAQPHAQQPPAAPPVAPGPTPAATAHPASGSDSQSCPNFRGQFIYPGDTPVTVKQEACSKLFFQHQDGTTATVILDGKAHKLQGDDSRSIVRTSAWAGSTVRIDDKIYKTNGEYTERVIRHIGVEAQGNIVLRTEAHAIIGGKEVPEGNPIVNVARRIGTGTAPIYP
jgi:hypothetical protein